MKRLILVVAVVLMALPALAQQSTRGPMLAPLYVVPVTPVPPVVLAPMPPPMPVYRPVPLPRLGVLSANPYLPGSTANDANRLDPRSVTNPYGAYGSPYSPTSATNPYTTTAPKLYGQDGKYLGKLSANPYDPDSTSNPYGRYGSPYSPTSVTNPYGVYGSPHSPLSATNPYATKPPVIVPAKK